jgi:hypothetical protein
MSPAEQAYLDRFGPQRHADARAIIDDIGRMDALVPSELCQCDEGHRCIAHVAAVRFATRRQPERMERFVGLVARWRR